MAIDFSQKEYNAARYRDKISVVCNHCKIIFPAYKRLIQRDIVSNITAMYCTRKCQAEARSLANGTVTINCLTCGKSRKYRVFEQKAGHKRFCSRSCIAKYYHKYRKITTHNRSKAELRIVELIHKDFPNLGIEENIRTLLPSGYEVDILIREKNLAIELNGPVHYFPIYGAESLNKTKNRDIIKQVEIQQLGINLFVLDISMLNSTKKHQTILDKMYYDNIKPLLL
jgi:hypothetical protein